MSKIDKLLKRFLSKPKDFKYSELKTLMQSWGYREISLGKTSGSKVGFVNDETGHIIKIVKPHSKPVVKRYVLDRIETRLRERGVIQ